MSKRLLPVLIACGVWSGHARAQAGPPLITNDTGTPGNGKWEINLAAAGARNGGDWNLALPDADINYGVGEHLQLSVHVAWQHARSNGAPLMSGLDATEYALRWRFLDQNRAGIDMAIQPHLVLPANARAIAKGLSAPHREFVLPLQIVRHVGDATVGIELARHWVEHERGAEQVGVFLAHDCGQAWECLAEVNGTQCWRQQRNLRRYRRTQGDVPTSQVDGRDRKAGEGSCRETCHRRLHGLPAHAVSAAAQPVAPS